MSRIINICVVLTMIAAHSWAEPNAGDVANAFIVHIPIPLAARGKPFPIIAGTKGDAGTLKDITVSIKSSGAAKGSKLKMRTMGDGRYQAIIPAKTTAAATELVYRIEATTALGINTTTPWYPVKLETLEDKVKDTVEKKAPDKKPGKIRKFVKAHPIATGVGAWLNAARPKRDLSQRFLLGRG